MVLFCVTWSCQFLIKTNVYFIFSVHTILFWNGDKTQFVQHKLVLESKSSEKGLTKNISKKNIFFLAHITITLKKIVLGKLVGIFLFRLLTFYIILLQY
jgi:hypothetical protein